MTRYQMQHEIFTLSMKLYPKAQHEEIYQRLEKLWKRTDGVIFKYLETLREITA
jgi:hypothetical protein